jgi:hypothetical protein
MNTLKAVDRSNRGASVANEGVDESNAIVVSEWDPDAHRRLSDIAEQRLLYHQ